MRGFVAALVALAAVCCADLAGAEETSPAPDDSAAVDVEMDAAPHPADAPPRMCFGGYEDGKVIVAQGRVKDAAAETTATVCRIDGGSQARAPQSPLIAARRFRVLV